MKSKNKPYCLITDYLSKPSEDSAAFIMSWFATEEEARRCIEERKDAKCVDDKTKLVKFSMFKQLRSGRNVPITLEVE